MDKYKLSLKKGETMNNKKLLKKGAAPVNAEIKKEKGEKKMKKFSVAGGVKNAWKNHKEGIKTISMIVMMIIIIVLLMRKPQTVVEYQEIPVEVEVIKEVPVEVPTATEEDNKVRN